MLNSNDNPNSINLSISGWSGSGATSLALILTKLLDYKYLHLGGVFRFIGEQLGHSEDGINRPKFDDYIEPIIGATADKYRDYKLLETDGVLADSDLGTFLIGKHPKVFSVFLKSSFEERAKKVVKDNREDAVSVLRARDEVNKNFYMNLHNVDVFDEDLIDRKFNLVINNSHLSLEAEVKMVLEEIIKTPHVRNNLDLADVYELMDREVEEFSRLGKDNYRNTLIDLDKVYTPSVIIEEMSKTFPEDVAEFPPNIQKVFISGS